jgi:hypothetical protein
LNLKKCNFFLNCVTYLGFTISVKGIEPGKDKLRAINESPVPTDVHKVRSFLGLVSFFRRFVKGFSVIAKPLSDLLRKGKSFEWIDPHQMAFAKLKEILMKSPVLCVYNPKTRTELHTDASSIGLGAVLMQKQSDGKLKPISYYSRILPVGNTFYYSYRL